MLHLLGGTAYLWDASFPLAVRLLTMFHVVWPVLLVWSLSRVGYDRRGYWLQVALASCLFVVARFTDPRLNINFAFQDPIFHRSLGPAPIHVAVSIVGLAVLVYLRRRRRRSDEAPQQPAVDAGAGAPVPVEVGT